MKPRIFSLLCVLGLGAALASSAFAQSSPAPTAPTTAAAAPAAPATSAPPAATVDRSQLDYMNAVAAIVNDKIVTVYEVRQIMNPQVKAIVDRVDNAGYPDEATARAEYDRQVNQLTHNTLDDLVNRILIVEEFHKKYQPMPQVYLDKVFEDYITVHFNGDHEAYLRALKAENMTERDLRKKLEETEIVNYMRGKLSSSVTGISPDRIVDFYNKNQDKFVQEAAIDLWQITLKPSPGTPPDVLLQKATYLVQQARAPGGDFAELARQNSQDEYAAKGGQCGWYELRRLSPIIRDPLSKLAPGQVSDPVVMDPAKVPAGQQPIPATEVGTIYIFKCDGKHEGGVQKLEDVRAQVENTLAVQDNIEAEKKWIERLRKDAYIHYNIGD